MIGVDYHPSFQQIAFLVKETGEYSERRLNHSDGEAEKFYRDLRQRGVQRASGDGGYRIFPLVRATAGRVGFRSVDRRSGGDQGQRASRSKRPTARMRNCC